MSSICGICRPDGAPVGRIEIESMLQALDYWNADQRGAWTASGAGLGHLLLTTTASRNESQPVRDEEADLTFAGDCRLDNRIELAGRLGVEGGELASESDGNLLLRAYRQWGEHCVAHLRGDFAFAIWDGRRRQLFCARDPFGVKPLYYHARGSTFAFASEMKGLLALPWIDRTVDETWIGDYLHHLSVDRVTTFYAAIKRLEPAHALTFAAQALRVYRYWSLDPHLELQRPPQSDPVDTFREQLELAVRRRIDTPFEVGAELSGGLDSAAICAIAQDALRERGRELQTFSEVLPESTPVRPDQPADARWAIDAVCKHAGITRTCFLAGEGGVLEELEWARQYYDEPPRTLVSLDYHHLYEAAAARGVRVLLSGFGGNFGVSASGKGRLRELLSSGRWLEYHREVSAIDPRPLGRLATALRPVLGLFDGPVADFLRQKGLWHAHATRPTRDDFARRIGMRTRTFRHARRYSARGNLRQMTEQLLEIALVRRLETAHVSATARRIEYRYPLLDVDLIALFVALPSAVKFWRGRDRHLFRQSIEGRVPDEVRLHEGPRASGNPGHVLRRARDGDRLTAMLAGIPADDPVLRYLDLDKLAAQPRIPGRVPRPRHMEMMMALLLADKLRHARQPAERPPQ